MSDNRWQRVEDIFHQAAGLAPAARCAFLDKACATDQPLRQEVESLLAHDVEDGCTFAGAAAHAASIPGSIAHYRILAKIGEGGMGAVYRATDTKLGRDVAIKVLPETFARDADRMARFTREARVLASLNHPHICTLHDVGPTYLVMELVEGRELQGPLPLAQALQYAAQIAGALDAAHTAKITHRDLKPANILITKSGGVKLLDFGLAKFDKTPTVESETAGMGLTGKGQILGTLMYMSPEQLNGQEVGPRSDIFSFGLVLYEMLTGKRAVDGTTPASVIATILERPAPSISDFAPAALDRVLKRCLAKDPVDRWQTARDLKFALEWAGEPVAALTADRPAVPRKTWQWLAAGACLLAGVFAAAWWRTLEPAPSPRLKTIVEPAHENSWRQPVLSPDGTRIAFSTPEGLRVRTLDSLQSQLIAGTDRSADPAWSPDGRFLAYVASDGSHELRKVDVAGGTPETLAYGLANNRGVAWSRDGTILYSTGVVEAGTPPVLRVSENGGTPVKVATGSQPTLLPDGRHFLYLAPDSSGKRESIYAGSLDSKDTREITEANSQAEFVPPGHLLFLRGTTLMTQPFDAGALRTTGQAMAVAEDVSVYSVVRRGSFSVARNGLIVYQSGGVGRTGLTWVDRAGKTPSPVDEEHLYFDIALSPDGKKIAAARVDPKTMVPGLWVVDTVRGISTQITPEGEDTRYPAWSPDGTRIAYAANGIRVKDAHGTGEEEVLAPAGEMPQWSPDGRTLVFVKRGEALMLVSTSGDRKTERYLTGDCAHPAFSPDGRWMAYALQQSGKWEVFVESVPAGKGRWQVSKSGGAQPIWRQDGTELFYRSPKTQIMAVPVRTGSTFDAGVPKELFAVFNPGLFAVRRMYAVSPDGQRFLVQTKIEDHAPMILLQNWLQRSK